MEKVKNYDETVAFTGEFETIKLGGQVCKIINAKVGKTTTNKDMLIIAFDIAEGRGYYQYFYSIAERLERVYERQWKKNSYAIQGKYDLTTLAVVPANTKPEFELYWRLMGQELKPDNISIKARKLKGHNLPDK